MIAQEGPSTGTELRLAKVGARFGSMPSKDETMNDYYLKQQHQYPNGEKTAMTYVRLSPNGNILVISIARRALSRPKTLTIMQDFEVITAEQFNEKLHEIAKELECKIK